MDYRMKGILASAFLLSGCAAMPSKEHDCFEALLTEARELRATGRLSWDKWDRLIDLNRTGDTRTRCDEARRIIDAPDAPRQISTARHIMDESI